MAQTGGIFDAVRDNTKKRVAAPPSSPVQITDHMTPAPTRRGEAVPGLMRTRNTLKGIRSSTIPKGHPKRG